MADYNKNVFGSRGYAAHRRVSPCRGCDDRYEGCHGKCERYIQWKAENNEYREGHLKEKYDAASVVSFELRNKKKREY